MAIVWFDLETTGVDKEVDEIIQIAAISTSNDLARILSQYEVKLYPTEAGIERVKKHKETIYDPETWAREAVAPHVGLDRFITYLRRHSTVPRTSAAGKTWRAAQLGGHNVISFDIPFLIHACRARELFLPIVYQGFDTLALAAAYQAVTGVYFDNLKLETLAAHFGANHERAHEAMSDIRATLEVARGLMDGLRNHP